MKSVFLFKPNLGSTGAGIALGLCVLLARPIDIAGAQGPQFMPAGFKDADQLEQIDISQRDLGRRKDAVSIRCQSFVETDGSLSGAHCVPPHNIEDQRVTRKIVLALENETINAARSNGSPVRVLMSFTVSIDCSSGPCSVRAVAHHGYSSDQFGDDYIAPQPILSGVTWYAGFADKLEWIGGWMPNVSRTFNHNLWPLRARYSLLVEADGSGSSGCIEFVSPAGDDQQQRNLNKLEAGLNSIGNVRFIPGMHDGRPVAMRLSESVVLRDAAQKVSARRLHDQGGRIANRLYTRRLADRAEAPELYCAE